MIKRDRYDTVIVGGSFAGLSAAIYLGRARRSVLVLDTGAPRNRLPTHHTASLLRTARTRAP